MESIPGCGADDRHTEPRVANLLANAVAVLLTQSTEKVNRGSGGRRQAIKFALGSASTQHPKGQVFPQTQFGRETEC
jgi:hypothetical protein